jgi:putative spermidine/putrescine transport system permease protein
MAAPLALVLLVFLVLPIIMIVVVSFWGATEFSIYSAFQFDNYEFLFLAGHLRCSSHTFKYAAITWALTLLIGFTVAYFLAFHVRSLTLADRAVPALHDPVLDLEHHPHDLVDPVSGPQRDRQFDADLLGRDRRAAGMAAVQRLLGDPRLRASLHAVHGGADLQHHDAHRQIPDRGGAGRGRDGLSDPVERDHPADQARDHDRHDLRRHAGDGRFHHRALHVGRQSANVGRLISNDIALLQYPSAAATAVVLLITVLIVIGILLRFVDIRKEL